MKCWIMIGLVAVVALAGVVAACVPALPEEIAPPPEETGFIEPDPHVTSCVPSGEYVYHQGFLLGVDVCVIVENKGGAGPVEVVFELSNKETERQTRFVYLEAGEERKISIYFDLSKHKTPSGAASVSVETTAKPAGFAVDSLMQDLDSKDLEVRKNAAILLGDLKVTRAVEPLIKILADDGSHIMRTEAAKALGKIKDERAVEPLIKALEDDEKSVRTAAITALGRIGDKRAVEPLIELLEDDDSWVRHKAAYALGDIKDERAIEPLEVVAKNDSSRLARDAANYALRQIRKK